MRNHLSQFLVLALAVFLSSSTQVRAAGGGEEVDYSAQVMHHISDANEFHFWGDIHIPLPVIAWSSDGGLFTAMSSSFYGHSSPDANTHSAQGHDDHSHDGHGHDHGDHAHAGDHGAEQAGHHGPTKVINGYFLDHGVLRRLSDPAARASVSNISGVEMRKDGNGSDQLMAISDGKAFAVTDASTLLGFTDWIDFSITKNVATMLMAMLAFGLIFVSVRNGYAKNKGRAPKGIQSFFEPIILFIRDDIAKEMIGAKWEKYFPFLCTLFFFILLVNLFGLIPIAPFGANVTGNIGLTLALAIVTFFVVNLSGNKHYWGHIFNMPGVPIALKPLMALIEVIGVFVKPFTLMIRLFANITAGHIIILSLIGLIFLFGENGASIGGTAAGAALSVPFVFVMNLLELFVAFLQSFIFTLLSALYIGGAVEEHHHADHDAEHASHVAA